MRILIGLLLLICFTSSFAQTKKPVKPKAPKVTYTDSVWHQIKTDTTRGVISVKLGNGLIQGEGIIVHTVDIERHEIIRNPAIPQPKVDSLGTSQNGFFFYFDGGGVNDYKRVYLKTEKGWEEVTDEHFDFIPYGTWVELFKKQ